MYKLNDMYFFTVITELEDITEKDWNIMKTEFRSIARNYCAELLRAKFVDATKIHEGVCNIIELFSQTRTCIYDFVMYLVGADYILCIKFRVIFDRKNNKVVCDMYPCLYKNRMFIYHCVEVHCMCENYIMDICGLPFLPEFILSNPRAGEIMRGLKNAAEIDM